VICTILSRKGTATMGSGSERAKALSESDTPAAPATAAFRKLLRSGSITAEWSPHMAIDRIFSLVGQCFRAWTSIFESV
jgi:hypothetical protein